MIMNLNNTTAVDTDSAGAGAAWFLRHVQALELVVAVVVFAAIHALRQKRRRGLPEWPFLGMLPSLAAAVRSDSVYEWISEALRSRGGTFRFRGPWLSSLNCVITADPRNLEHLLKSRFSNFPKGPYFRDTVNDLLGAGIFAADGDAWRQQRKTASIEFHSARFRAMTLDSLRELVHARLVPVLDSSADAPVDLQEILLRLTFDNVCIIAFGADPGCLREGLPSIPFARAFEDATEATVLRFVTPAWLWRAMRWLRVGPERRLAAAIGAVDEFADGVIRARKKEMALGTRSTSDLLTVFIGARDEQGRDFPEKFLRDICVNFILAGRDTSSVALTWFFWLLHRHPAVEERIFREVCAVAAESGDGPVFGAEDIKKMEYLQAAISEALRLYPSVPVDHKEVLIGSQCRTTVNSSLISIRIR